VSRLWAQNEAVPASEGARLHLVVATVHKLQGCIGDGGYDWLAEAGCVVVDEAHSSTERMYTSVLDWLGLGRGKDRCPLVGLTATPFRGTSETETTRLVNRYGKRRLDLGVLSDDPYVELQRRGVLASVRHQVLSGSDIDLTDQELDHLREFRQLPKSVEERLGANRARNDVLMTSIAGLPDDWTVLLFATSVDHAETLAALLTLDGIPAAAISGTTEPGARRHYVSEFRKGRLRVLTNYNVLTQGFDAPAVQAVYVARPTYSPNTYQQMIGRGLRGPMNGGTAECMIVNVADNVSQFGEELAFRQFEYLWTSV
jgi:superfamily II DNA or RNA helicase